MGIVRLANMLDGRIDPQAFLFLCGVLIALAPMVACLFTIDIVFGGDIITSFVFIVLVITGIMCGAFLIVTANGLNMEYIREQKILCLYPEYGKNKTVMIKDVYSRMGYTVGKDEEFGHGKAFVTTVDAKKEDGIRGA